jgi:hypothetical protein
MCSKCKVEKPETEFSKNGEKLRSYCKECAATYYKKWSSVSANEIRKNEQNKAWKEDNKEHLKDYDKEYYKKHKEHKLEWHQKYYQKNKMQRRQYSLDYYKKNKKQVIENQKIRRQEDTNYRIASNLRCRIWIAIKKNQKGGHLVELLGCSVESLKVYLGEHFLSGMSWDNYGRGKNKWHIDHIKPCASFDLSDPEQQKQCFNYKNLQPLWEEDNLSKGAKLESFIV